MPNTRLWISNPVQLPILPTFHAPRSFIGLPHESAIRGYHIRDTSTKMETLLDLRNDMIELI